MTTQLVNIDAFDYGAGTFVVKLRNASDLSITVATAATVVASANVAARYIATFSTLVASGVYYVEFVVNGAIYPQWVTLTGVDGEATETRNERGSVLLTATQASIDAVQAIAAGTVSGAGTDTEVFVGTNATVTVTADSSGNRSAVVVT